MGDLVKHHDIPAKWILDYDSIWKVNEPFWLCYSGLFWDSPHMVEVAFLDKNGDFYLPVSKETIKKERFVSFTHYLKPIPQKNLFVA